MRAPPKSPFLLKCRSWYRQFDRFSTSKAGQQRIRRWIGWSTIAVLPSVKFAYYIKGQSVWHRFWYATDDLDVGLSQYIAHVGREYESTLVAGDVRQGKISYDPTDPSKLPRLTSLISQPTVLEPKVAGTTAFSSGLQIVWPRYLTCTSREEVMNMMGSYITDPVSGKQVPLTEEIADTLVLSAHAKRYLVASQLRINESAINTFIEPLLMGGFSLISCVSALYLNDRLHTFKRWSRQARCTMYAGLWGISLLCYIIQRDTTCMSSEARASRTAMLLSDDHRRGAGEYIRQTLARNRLIDAHFTTSNDSQPSVTDSQRMTSILPEKPREDLGKYYKANGDYLTKLPYRPRCSLLANVKTLRLGTDQVDAHGQPIDQSLFADYSDELT